jgi:hypothetical protein
LCTTSDEQYESIPDDEITLQVRKFHVLHRFHKERRRSPRGCFECGDTTHFITDYPKRKKFDSSNKYNYNNRNDSNDKGEGKKKFQKMMSRACATLSDLNFSSDDSSSSKEDERHKRKTDDFTGFASWASHHGISPTLMQVMTRLLRVFLCKSPNLKMLFATKTSCLVKSFVRTRN